MGSAAPEPVLAALGPRQLTGFVKKMENEMATVNTAIKELYKGLNAPDYDMPPVLDGNSVEDINRTLYLMASCVAAITLFGACIDIFCRCKAMEGRPKLWAIALLFSSYLLLIPGLTSVLLSFAIVVNVIGHRINVHPHHLQNSCTESTPGLVHLLHRSGGNTGAALLVLFAMVVPAVELILLIIGELFRFRNCPCCARSARAVIIWVQHRSKWASPDMFAYILLVHLVRGMQCRPLILTDARLDVGFSAFCGFCILATISSMGFPLPKAPVNEEVGVQEEVQPPLSLRLLGRQGVAFVVFVLTLAFAVLLGMGLRLPCLSLHINQKPLYQPVGPLPLTAKPAVDALDVPAMLNADVSIEACLSALLGRLKEGEANSALAFTMYAIFVIGLTCLDMLVLLIAAVRICSWGSASSRPCSSVAGESSSMPRPCCFLVTAGVLKKLSMLDVSIVGVFLMTYCMEIYKKIGVIVSTRRGLLALFGAEVIHTFTYFIVTSAVEYATSQAAVYIATSGDDSANDACFPSSSGSSCCGIKTKRPLRFGVLLASPSPASK